MLKWATVALGVAALTIGSAAGAAVTVNGASPNILPTPNVVYHTAETSILWEESDATGGSYTGYVDFTNTLSGIYQIVVNTSTFNATINSITLNGIDGTSGSWSILNGTGDNLTLNVPFAANGEYEITFTGTDPADGGVATGNLSFQSVAVPEAGTWAMMLLGFGAIGVALRRRRQPALVQLA